MPSEFGPLDPDPFKVNLGNGASKGPSRFRPKGKYGPLHCDAEVLRGVLAPAQGRWPSSKAHCKAHDGSCVSQSSSKRAVPETKQR